jgi:hypothetical protein
LIPPGLDQNFNLELEPSGNDAQVRHSGRGYTLVLWESANGPPGHPHPKI